MHIYVNLKKYVNPFKTPWMVPSPRAWRVHLGAIFMHELGHTLGIFPWTIEGCDNRSSFHLPFTKGWKEYREKMGSIL
jgi:hypothetical protein